MQRRRRVKKSHFKKKDIIRSLSFDSLFFSQQPWCVLPPPGTIEATPFHAVAPRASENDTRERRHCKATRSLSTTPMMMRLVKKKKKLPSFFFFSSFSLLSLSLSLPLTGRLQAHPERQVQQVLREHPQARARAEHGAGESWREMEKTSDAKNERRDLAPERRSCVRKKKRKKKRASCCSHLEPPPPSLPLPPSSPSRPKTLATEEKGGFQRRAHHARLLPLRRRRVGAAADHSHGHERGIVLTDKKRGKGKESTQQQFSFLVFNLFFQAPARHSTPPRFEPTSVKEYTKEKKKH